MIVSRQLSVSYHSIQPVFLTTCHLSIVGLLHLEVFLKLTQTVLWSVNCKRDNDSFIIVIILFQVDLGISLD